MKPFLVAGFALCFAGGSMMGNDLNFAGFSIAIAGLALINAEWS